MQDLNDLALYAAVVRHKGFTAAANALSLPKSKISKRVAALEEQLGVRLIERSTRKLSITDIGQSFYERCEAVLSGVEAAEAVTRMMDPRMVAGAAFQHACQVDGVELTRARLQLAFLVARRENQRQGAGHVRRGHARA